MICWGKIQHVVTYTHVYVVVFVTQLVNQLPYSSCFPRNVIFWRKWVPLCRTNYHFPIFLLRLKSNICFWIGVRKHNSSKFYRVKLELNSFWIYSRKISQMIMTRKIDHLCYFVIYDSAFFFKNFVRNFISKSSAHGKQTMHKSLKVKLLNN